MVSLRCKLMVKAELEKLDILYNIIELGVVEITSNISEEKRQLLNTNLKASGLELLDDKKSILIEKIRNTIIDIVHHSEEQPDTKYSELISSKLGYDYTYLANIFSEVTGITIQHFIIINKIEKAKELLLYNELNLTEISYKLNYSSVAHLSAQFKKITGLTPTFFKKLGHKRRIELENV